MSHLKNRTKCPENLAQIIEAPENRNAFFFFSFQAKGLTKLIFPPEDARVLVSAGMPAC